MGHAKCQTLLTNSIPKWYIHHIYRQYTQSAVPPTNSPTTTTTVSSTTTTSSFNSGFKTSSSSNNNNSITPGSPLLLRGRTHYTQNLPVDTPRLQLDDGSLFILRHSPPKTYSSYDSLPPRVRTFPKRTPMTPEQIQEARDLRLKDPETWTVRKLCKKYNTFPGMILKITECPKERKEELMKEKENWWKQLPVSKKKVIIDRQRRKALW